MILLLRPTHKIVHSTQYMLSKNISCVGVGLIEVSPDDVELTKLNHAIASYPLPAPLYVAVTSTVAANLVKARLSSKPESIVFWAIGQTTAAILEQQGLQVQSPNVETSEGFLTCFAPPKNERATVFLIKGHGGRTLIRDALMTRGFQVQEFNVYRRNLCPEPLQTGVWNKHMISGIVATSAEILMAAFETYDNHWLCSLPWIVPSERIRKIAYTQGIHTVHNSEGAHDENIERTYNQFWSAI